MRLQELLNSNLMIRYALRGSHSRGLDTPESDKDYFGVFIPPIETYLGFRNKEFFQSVDGDEDYVIYDIKKYIELLANSNPNVLESLWVTNFVEIDSESFQSIVKRRKLFATKKIYDTFTGYAINQLRRIETLSQAVLSEYEDLENLMIAEGIDLQEISPKQSVRDRISRDGKKLDVYIQKYVQMRKKYFNGNGRLGDRRRNSIKKLGYNAKNCMVLILLLKQCIEFLNSGELIVDRSHDKVELLSIKNGEWALNDIKQYAEELFLKAADAHKKSSLPEEVDRNAVENLLVSVLKTRYNIYG